MKCRDFVTVCGHDTDSDPNPQLKGGGVNRNIHTPSLFSCLTVGIPVEQNTFVASARLYRYLDGRAEHLA